MPARVLLLDLDGVLRRWDPAADALIEQTHGLAPGDLLATGFADARELVRAGLLGG